MEFLTTNWELILVVFLVIDKAVAMSKSPYDDLIWESVKKLLISVKAMDKEKKNA